MSTVVIQKERGQKKESKGRPQLVRADLQRKLNLSFEG